MKMILYFLLSFFLFFLSILNNRKSNAMQRKKSTICVQDIYCIYNGAQK